MLIFNDVSIIIGKKIIFEKLNIEIQDVGLICILGGNGTGKTTLLKSIVSKNLINSGYIVFKDKNGNISKDIREKVVYIPDDLMIYDFLTGNDFINLIRSLRACDDTCFNYYINNFNIKKFMNLKISEMSLGVKKKLTLVSGLISKFDIILFDEPTNGLDIISKKFFNDLIYEISLKKTVIITTHDINFIENFKSVNIIKIDDLK